MENIPKYNDEINNKGIEVVLYSKNDLICQPLINLFSFILDLIIQKEDYNIKSQFKILACK